MDGSVFTIEAESCRIYKTHVQPLSPGTTSKKGRAAYHHLIISIPSSYTN